MIGRRTNRVRVVLLGTGLALLLSLGGTAALRSQSQNPAPEEKPSGFLRCPECGLEMPGADRPTLCPRCGQKRITMEFSTTRKGDETPGPSFSWRLPLTVGGVALVLGAALYLLSRKKSAGASLRAAEDRERRRRDAEREAVIRQQEAYEFRSARKRKGKR